MKKLIVWLLCVAMVLSLAACGAAEEAEAPVESAAVEEAPAEAPAAEAEQGGEDAMAEYEAMMKAYEEAIALLGSKLAAFDKDAVVMTVDGQEITWDVYFYMINSAISSYVNQLGTLPEDFSIEFSEGMSVGELFRDSAEERIFYYAATAAKAAERGIALSEEVETELEEAWAQLVEENGGEEALQELLDEQGLTRNAILYYSRVDALCEELANEIYGDGSSITNEDAEAWAGRNGMVRAKHILLMTEGLSDGEKAEVKAEAEEILAELQTLAGDNAALEEHFTAIMNEKSEDTGLAYFPDGYVFGTGEMVAEFEAAAFALEHYGLSDIVETSYGYHILLCLPMDTQTVVEFDGQQYTRLWAWVAADLFAQERAAWAAEAEIVYDEAFADFSVEALFA